MLSQKKHGLAPRAGAFVVLGLVLVTLVLAGCTSPFRSAHERSAQPGALFRHRWWNYYARALERADDNALADARADLKAALRQRGRDQRMARTYGMHYRDYFPHRELGVLAWRDGDLQTAEKELRKSLEQYPTAKARFYLDLVRRTLIRRRGAAVPPPEITLEASEDVLWSRRQAVAIKGRVSDPNYVQQVFVNGRPLLLDGSRASFDFSHALTLPQGCHEIVVEAVNLAGRRSRRTVKVCADRLGPAVVLDRMTIQDGRILLRGEAYDPAGVAAVRVNDVDLPAAGAPETLIEHTLAGGAGDVVIECRDRLGNQSRFRLDPAQWQGGGVRPKTLAGLELAGLFESSDQRPPVLQLQDWQARQSVYLDQVVITGSVRDPDKVSVLTINDEPVLPRDGALVFFCHIVSLEPGVNTIVLKARDAAGYGCTRQVVIERRIPKALMLEQRLRLTIFAFEHKGRVSPAGFAFQDDFIHELIERRRFQVVERQRLDLILQEHKINHTDLIDAGTAVRVGNLAAAQAVVAGSLVESATGIEIVGRVIDSETGDIVCTVDAYGEDKTLPGLKVLAKAMALKIHREFPLVNGRVLDRRDNTILTDLTLEDLRVQRRILVYAENPVAHPETHATLGVDYEVLGTARVTQADDHLSKARLNKFCKPFIGPKHRVITQ